MRRRIGDHEGIICSQFGRRHAPGERRIRTHLRHLLAETAIGTDPPTDSELITTSFPSGIGQLGHQHIGDSLLKGGTDIGQLVGGKPFIQKVANGSFQTAEAEMQIAGMQHAPREVVSGRVPLTGQTVNLCSAGITKAKQLRDFVECLSGSVVPGLAEQTIPPMSLDIEKQSMPAAHDQGGVRRHDILAEKGRQHVALQMINGEVRAARPQSQSLGRGNPDQQGRRKTWATGGGKGIDPRKTQARFSQSFIDQRWQEGQMIA